MNITSIALDDFIAVFTAALAEADFKIAEQYLAVQNEMKEKYGAYFASFASRSQTLRVKRGIITVMARPFLKTETGSGGGKERIYLKFTGLNTREMRFEVALE
jgi:hypothetical protein